MEKTEKFPSRRSRIPGEKYAVQASRRKAHKETVTDDGPSHLEAPPAPLIDIGTVNSKEGAKGEDGGASKLKKQIRGGDRQGDLDPKPPRREAKCRQSEDLKGDEEFVLTFIQIEDSLEIRV